MDKLLSAIFTPDMDRQNDNSEDGNNLYELWDRDLFNDSFILPIDDAIFDMDVWPNQTGNDSSGDYLELVNAAVKPNYWCLLLIVFPVLTVFGNVLVCMSVYNEKALHTVTNYFIVSLAIADIMVAILVMPLAVYVEVSGSIWLLGDALCDTWVAFDVMCCTSSILNLTAISVDRYIAVTRPIQYAKHRNSRRIHLTLGLTWVVSIAVSSPIALGANYTTLRAQTPLLCTFYNSDFLIGSSMTSFYIPCLLMILLYWRTFRAINARASKMAAMTSSSTNTNRKSLLKTALTGRGSSTAVQTVALSGGTASGGGGAAEFICLDALQSATTSCSDDEIARVDVRSQSGTSFSVAVRVRDGSNAETTALAISTGNGYGDYKTFEQTSSDPSDLPSDTSPLPASFAAVQSAAVSTPVSGLSLMTNTGENQAPAAAFIQVSNEVNGNKDDQKTETTRNENGSSARQAPLINRRRRRRLRLTTTPVQPTSTGNDVIGRTGRHGRLTSGSSNCASRSGSSSASVGHGRIRRSSLFGFGALRSTPTPSPKSDSKLSTKRERKATKTLAIVLGVFLLCWVPFFSINIINAVCIRDDRLFTSVSVCNIHPMLFSLFVWLGYINSFLNPLIYTIFNIEFRKAFKKILFQRCQR